MVAHLIGFERPRCEQGRFLCATNSIGGNAEKGKGEKRVKGERGEHHGWGKWTMKIPRVWGGPGDLELGVG